MKKMTTFGKPLDKKELKKVHGGGKQMNARGFCSGIRDIGQCLRCGCTWTIGCDGFTSC